MRQMPDLHGDHAEKIFNVCSNNIFNFIHLFFNTRKVFTFWTTYIVK
jgi:hypothetical protein